VTASTGSLTMRATPSKVSRKRASACPPRRLGSILINVLTRLMGMILAAIAVEMTAGGLRDLFPQPGPTGD
jgi:hypothetical protein